MANIPLDSIGTTPSGTMVYVMQFPNPFENPNPPIPEDKIEKIIIKKARKYFLRIYKTTADNDDKQIIPQISEDSFHWLRDGMTDEEKLKQITKTDFNIAVISSILYTIKYELGMDYSLLLSRDKDEFFCKIYVTEQWLYKKALDLEYQLQFKKKHSDHDFQKVPPYGPVNLMEKSLKNKNLFKRYDENDKEITESSENDQNSQEKGSLFTHADKARIVIDELIKRVDLHALKKFQVMTEDFCVHQKEPLDKLKSNWANFKSIFKKQPLDDIRIYFSEKVSLYFAWIGTYLHFMFLAALVGVLVTIGFIVSENVFETKITMDGDYEIKQNVGVQAIQIFFAVFLSFWASFFDQIWTRKEKVFAWQWGTVDLASQEVQRPEFEGEFKRDEITGKIKIVPITSFKNKIRTYVTYSCILVFISIVIIAVVGIFTLRYYMNHTKGYSKITASLIPAFLNFVQIRVLNIVYGKVAVILNDWENHETENLYNDNLALKLFLFKFVNCYSGLFYIAFLKYPVENDPVCKYGCMEPLGFQLMVIIGMNLFLNGLELGLPWLKWKLKLRSEQKKIDQSQDPTLRKDLYPVEEQSKLEPYESPLEDYMEMALQFGFVALFGASFPLIGVLALIEIFLEIRVDAWKLCLLTRRPDPNRSEDIGIWKTIVVTIAYAGAISNSGIVVFTSGMFYEWNTFDQIVLFILLEHFLLLGMYIISILIPDQPTIVKDGVTWSKIVVTKKNLIWKEGASEKTAEFNTSTGKEKFILAPSDLRYIQDD